MRTFLMASVALASAILATAPARADLLMKVDSLIIADNSTQDSDARTGVISYLGQTGSFSLDLSTQTGTFSASPLYLDLANSLVNSRGAGLVTISLTSTGLTSPASASSFLTQFSGNFSSPGASVTATSYLDTTNAAFGTATQLSSLSSNTTPFGVSDTTVAGGTTPFSLTEILTIVARETTNFSLDTSITSTSTPVPEPATLGLLGAGLFGMMAMRHRRKAFATATCA